MRRQNRILLWPIYFDASTSRADGRRVPKKLAVSSPKLEELQLAAKRVGLNVNVIVDAAHPRFPWRKSGLLIVPKTESKNKVLKRVAEELSRIRG